MTTGTDAEPPLNPIEELRALAGIHADVDQFEVLVDDVRMRVRYIGGSSRTVILSVSYDAFAKSQASLQTTTSAGYRSPAATSLRAIRPMKIKLTPEQPAHVEGKATGGDAEHQTGDKAFDAGVYIDAPSTEPLGPIFSIDAVRRAVLELFAADFTSIEIDDGSLEVSATCVQFAAPTLESHSQGQRGAEAFALLAKSLPAIAASGGAHAPDRLSTKSAIVMAIGVMSFFLVPPGYFILHSARCTEDGPFLQCFGPGLIGAGIGLVLAVLAVTFTRPVLRAKYGGTSRSSSRIDQFATGFAFITFWTTLLLVSLAWR